MVTPAGFADEAPDRIVQRKTFVGVFDMHRLDSPETTIHHLDADSLLFETPLPAELLWDESTFETVWALRPRERHRVKMIGKLVELPRDQQAYGATYKYTGSENRALPIPAVLKPLLEWTQEQIAPQLNGLLLNWYQGPSDYIGPHHDSTRGLIPETPIVTISFGEPRTFRLTQWRQKKKIAQHDFTTSPGRVFVMPWPTNKAWKHEVVKRAGYNGRRISVTLRAFNEGVLPPETYFE